MSAASRTTRRWAYLLSFLACTTPLYTSGAKPASDVQFNWPDDLNGSGTLIIERTRRGKTLSTPPVQFSIQTSRSNEGLIVSMQPSTNRNPIEIAWLQMRGYFIDFVVSADGTLRALSNADSISESLSNYATEAGQGANSRTVEVMLARLSDPEVLRSAAEGRWDELVTTWVNENWVQEERNTYDTVIPHPLLGNVPISGQMHLDRLGFVDCGAGTKRCVQSISSSMKR